MESNVEEIVNYLRTNKQTIATMESCTGGFIINELTNISGCSEVVKVSLITYSNEYKIKFGVNPDIIDEFSVYSQETANEMAKNITQLAKSTWGIGITGQLGRIDPKNPGAKINEAYYTFYNSIEKQYYPFRIILDNGKRHNQKKQIANNIFINLKYLLINEKKGEK